MADTLNAATALFMTRFGEVTLDQLLPEEGVRKFAVTENDRRKTGKSPSGSLRFGEPDASGEGMADIDNSR
ncbi:hypothetical protein D6851_09615 [Altericroceibacterium spongiae]|uniref:Uncharacterized protein n=1 Tax=Altericroceibacterium spongiae TaxID=2320269 RepID=A0A420EKP2_9SPHN|nr:hypothetical protein [Altericroceibacterium spongiae]RKF21166.1 hypothetical protein D6851_09615 [Altericroceibacterium spongiae]